ncbi:regulatory protein RecX [Serratia sp. UGAL515B_01]|uniref:regulatory protein RecX n=1 Tax=Serratia sp. UGAL515B_01 TaxID=2986763 RepID=UPI002955221B|nr:regulatory protein RecX [Serratia sp. UGAL515B_01]WON76391.1 recombination regulator RecX [Serratia sp. UGAL515B_01]
MKQTVDPSSGNKQNALLSRAMRLLSQRDHSEEELRRKLAAPPFVSNPTAENSAKFVDPAIVEQVIAYCYQHNWLDDLRFAYSFIASRSRKGYGAQRIRSELLQKGVEKETVQVALAECGIDWCEQAKQVARHKFGELPPQEWREKGKLQRYLLYRGFFMEEIQSIYRDFAQ